MNANINFISLNEKKVVQDQNIPKYCVKTYERGAGLTLACGTGVCSCFIAAVFTKRVTEETSFQTKGGILTISLDEKEQVWMKGPSVYICEGNYSEHLLKKP